jgi:hypothetical protein
MNPALLNDSEAPIVGSLFEISAKHVEHGGGMTV